MKKFTVDKQMDLLREKRFGKLIAYAKSHKVHPEVVVAALTQLKEMTDGKETPSIH